MKRLAGIFLSLLSLAATRGVVASPGPDSGPETDAPFTSSPESLLAAAANTAPDEPVVAYLLDEMRWTFDAAGRSRRVHRAIYVVRHEEAMDGWANVTARWRPWREDRPDVRARVVTSDGAVHELDPASLGEYGRGESGPAVYEDTRSLEGPLPSVAPGSVVELSVAVAEHAPWFEAGSVREFAFPTGVPSERTRLVVEYPASLSLRWSVRGGTGVEPARSEAGGVVRLAFERGPTPEAPPREPYAPVSVPLAPVVGVSTGESWPRIAAAYDAMVERSLAGGDVRSAVRGLTRGHDGREDKLAAIVAKLHRDVRYTGVEIDDASLVPRTPEETLRRGFGDCKDKATLLVAMLRAAGFEAHLALLRTGPGPDVDPELPGLGTFDHAIVHVAGDPPNWIDATADSCPIGSLPRADRGRAALIAAKETLGLLTIPEAAPDDNRVVESRVITFAEAGKGSVVETTTAFGDFDFGYRAERVSNSEEDLRKAYEGYVKSTYDASALDAWTSSDARKLGTPFELRLEASGAGVVRTGRDDAAAAISVATLIAPLTGVLRAGEPTTDPTAPGKVTPRTEPLQFPEASTREWRMKVVPPDGFRARPLPPDVETGIGLAKFGRAFALEPDGSVVAKFALTVPLEPWTAEQVNDARRALDRLTEEPPVVIGFDQVGELALASGDVKRALAEFRRLEGAHPKRAMPRTRASRAYLAAGLGEAAVREAKAAVAVEPDSATAWASLGWALQHDAAARRFGPGWDRDGAIVAHRKAAELVPDDLVIGMDLAIVLEHDVDGVRYGPRADVAGAIDAYRRIRALAPDPQIDTNLLVALGLGERFAETRELAAGLPQSPLRDGWWIASIAADQGTERALAMAPGIAGTGESRRKALQTASSALLLMRRYPEAATLLAEGARGDPNAVELAGRSALLRKVRRFEEVAQAEEGPRGLMFRFIATFFRPEVGREGLAELVTENLLEEEGEDSVAESLASATRKMRRMMRGQSLRDEAILDFAASLMETSVEGDEASGWRISVSAPQASGTRRFRLFAVPGPKGPRIAGAADAPAPLAVEVLRRLDAGDVAGARKWLDWAKEEVSEGTGSDPLSGYPFARRWKAGEPADDERMRVAAALLGAHDATTAKRVLPILERARSRAAADDPDAVWLDKALVVAYAILERYADGEPIARRVLEGHPDSAWAFSALLNLLQKERKSDEVGKLAERRLEQHRDDPAALRALAWSHWVRGDGDGGDKVLARLWETGQAESEDANSFAWSRLVRGIADEETLEFARRAVRESGESSYGSLHTLALALAETGAFSESAQTLGRADDVRDRRNDSGSEWYVVGRIAELLDSPEDARRAYERVRPSKSTWPESTCWYLAAKRMEALSKSTKPK